jgi:hypothetical protein
MHIPTKMAEFGKPVGSGGEKAGGRVGIVGTGHRARVCFLFHCFFLFLLLSLITYIVCS